MIKADGVDGTLLIRGKKQICYEFRGSQINVKTLNGNVELVKSRIGINTSFCPKNCLSPVRLSDLVWGILIWVLSTWVEEDLPSRVGLVYL